MDMEVELVWKSQWKPTKVLYLMNRYLIIADAIVLELRKIFIYFWIEATSDNS